MAIAGEKLRCRRHRHRPATRRQTVAGSGHGLRLRADCHGLPAIRGQKCTCPSRCSSSPENTASGSSTAAMACSPASSAATATGRALDRRRTRRRAAATNWPVADNAGWHKVIREKRATFSCRPVIPRPACATSNPRVMLAGDYTWADYPATLEGAVRSGLRAAHLLLRNRQNPASSSRPA